MNTLEIHFNGPRNLAAVLDRLQPLPFKVAASDEHIVVENKKLNARCFIRFEGDSASSGTTMLMDYRDVEMTKVVVKAIVEGEQDAVVDVDMGYVLSKAELLDRMRNEPAWNWLRQS